MSPSSSKTPRTRSLPPNVKEGIINLYTMRVLVSKAAVPPHSSNALYDFIRTTIGPDDLSTSVLSTMEKALLQSPEYSLSGTLSLVNFSPPLNSAKSSNPTVRTNASALVKVLVSKFPTEFLENVLSEVPALPLTGRTTGVDHRTTLDTMLMMFPKHSTASMTLVNNLPMLIVKETKGSQSRSLRAPIRHVLLSA
ncbi:hypothetical protein HD554DRAFT_2145036 [Boletus coccyginus]|nr:hypothetical protein HD554DRAFT_2145036 [Boletus coccyginus]